MKNIFNKRLVIDTVLVTLVTLISFFILTWTNTTHFLLFIIPVPLAIFTIKYEDAIASIPLAFVIALSPFILLPLGGFNPMMEGFVVLTITAIVGILHGYIAERHMNHQLRLLLIIIADIVANFLILFIFSEQIFGLSLKDEVVHYVHSIFELIGFLNPSPMLIELSEYYAISILTSIIIVTGVVEAILTHVVTHALAKRVFKVEYGHTFTGIHMFVPRPWSIVFFPVLVLTAIFIMNFGDVTGFLEVLLIIGMNIVAISYVFYVLEGYTTLIRFIACRYHKRMYLWPTIGMLLLSPLFYILGLLDSFFLFQPKLRILIRRKSK